MVCLPNYWYGGRRPAGPSAMPMVCMCVCSEICSHISPCPLQMSRRAYPSNPAVPTRSNQFPPSGSAGQTLYYGTQNVQSQPQPVEGYQAQLPGQAAQNFTGQPMQNVYGHPVHPTALNAPGPPQSSAQVPGPAGQNFPNRPVQSFAGPPSNVSSLAAGVQQMQMGHQGMHYYFPKILPRVIVQQWY